METCYRHRNRETGVACSNCGRPICPECMTSTSVGMRCPECAGQTTRMRRGAGVFSSAKTPWATYTLIAINVAAFIAELAGGGAGSISGGGSVVGDAGLFGPAVASGDWYRILTAGFLHAGPLHLLFNMYVLYVAGTLLEPGIGTPRFVALYFVSLFAGSFGALLLDPHSTTVGASGAIFGLMAAAVVIARGRGREEVVSQFGFFIVLNLVLTFAIPGISIGGHLGGLAGGALAALLIIGLERRRERGLAVPLEIAGMAVLAIVAVGGALAAANAA
jgi:membrane associated rhomboid family serine protease